MFVGLFPVSTADAQRTRPDRDLGQVGTFDASLEGRAETSMEVEKAGTLAD